MRTTNVGEYKTDDNQRVEASESEMQNGTSFEMDPTINPEGRLLDINFALTHHYAPPIPRWTGMTAGSSPKVEARWTDSPVARIQTALTFNDRSVRLLGVWALEGVPDPQRTNAMQAAFLRVAVVNILPLEDKRAEEILKSRGEAVERTPKGVRPIADPDMPPGMMVRRFRVPPDYLSMGGSAPASAGAAPADPFASGAVPNERRFTRDITVEEILKSQGIPFPKGASANFLSATSELVVRNLPANLDLVAAYLESLKANFPKSAGFTLQVVQAEAALIRRLERETLFSPDHTAAWQAIEDAAAQGKAKIVRSLWLETKAGQRAIAENIIEYAKSGGLGFGDSSIITPSAPSPSPDAGHNKAPAPSAVDPTSHFIIAAAPEFVPVGLRMEVDPTIGANATSIDLNVAVNYDYAPPTQRGTNEPAPEQTQRLAVPQTEFRRMDFNTASTLLSGSTRLLSVWKPSGTPELDGDVLQAVFLQANIVKVEETEKK